MNLHAYSLCEPLNARVGHWRWPDNARPVYSTFLKQRFWEKVPGGWEEKGTRFRQRKRLDILGNALPADQPEHRANAKANLSCNTPDAETL
jgi:hypothetical protein